MMTTSSELDKLFRNTRPLVVDRFFKGFFIADLHAGVKDGADDFQKNEPPYVREILHHRALGFKIFGLGDIEELWENSDPHKIRKCYPWIEYLFDYRIKGNHDGDLHLPEAIVLQYTETGEKVLLVHGHQGDFFNDDGYPLGRFFVRHIWRNLQMLGFKDPTTAAPRNPKKHEAVKRAILKWSRTKLQRVLFGHTHVAQYCPPYYFNAGSGVGQGGSAIVMTGDKVTIKLFN